MSVNKKNNIWYNGVGFDKISTVYEVAMQIFTNMELSRNRIFSNDHNVRAKLAFDQAEIFWNEMCNRFPDDEKLIKENENYVNKGSTIFR